MNAEVIENLRGAIAELESGNGLERFVEGHGLQSRRFKFAWHEPPLNIDIRLPYARVLSDEAEQRADEARIGAACRMALLLITAVEKGSLLSDGETSLSARSDEYGTRFFVYGPDGAALDSGEGWEVLVERLKAALPADAGSVQVFWP